MTAWHRERWRKLYLREPLEQEAWAWHTRGLRNLLIQRAEDDGFVSKSRLALKIALRGDEVFQLAIDTLLEDGFLVENEAGIFVRNLPLAQGDDDESDAGDEPSADETPEQRRRRLARARAKRARDAKKGAPASRPERDDQRDEMRTQSVTDSVTGRDASRPPLSPSHSPSPHPASQNIQKNQTEETIGSDRARVTERDGARDGARDGDRDAGAYASRVTERTQSVTERDAPTPCPFDLMARARAAGLLASLAKRLKASEADVEAVTAEFVEFWTVERGGQAQRNWLGKLRAWIETKARAGELRGAGAIASDAETPIHPRAAARLAAQRAEAERVQAELAKTVVDAPRRDISALVAGIGGDG